MIKKTLGIVGVLLIAGLSYAGEIVDISTNNMAVLCTGFEILKVEVDSVSKDRTVSLRAVIETPGYTNEVDGVTIRSKNVWLARVIVTADEIEAANSDTDILTLPYGTIETTVRTLGLSKVAEKLSITP